MSTTDIDHGWQRIKENMRVLDNSYTAVGFPEDGKVEPPEHEGSGHEPIEDMPEMVKIAATHEYGSDDDTIPMRSFLRSTIDKQRKVIERIKTENYSDVIHGVTKPKQMLGLLGEWVTNEVKKTIETLRTPDIKEATKKKKGSTNPLIDRGQMIQTVQHKEVMK